MRTLYLECNMGAAGDMLTAALLALIPEPNIFLEKMNALGLDGVNVSAETVSKIGISGMQVNVNVNGSEEHSEDVHSHDHAHYTHDHHENHDHTHTHSHEHTHHHEHEHAHSSLQDILTKIKGLNVSESVKGHAGAIYKLLAEAESHAHGTQVSDIHFHEVGTLDAIADIVGVCLLLEILHPEQVIVSPVNVGSGSVRCAHGILPVPAPAAAYLLRNVPIYSGNIEGELCTPTGAAILKHFASAFRTMPMMQTEQIGYGLGKKTFEQLNCVRAFLGQTPDESGQIAELICNVDDMTGEELGFAQDILREAGAREVFSIPVMMKKGRPGVMLVCLCSPEQRSDMMRLIFKHTSTIGIRSHLCERCTLERQIFEQETALGTVRTKSASGFDIVKSKPEYEDIAKIAKENDLTFREVLEILRREQ